MAPTVPVELMHACWIAAPELCAHRPAHGLLDELSVLTVKENVAPRPIVPVPDVDPALFRRNSAAWAPASAAASASSRELTSTALPLTSIEDVATAVATPSSTRRS